MPARQLAVVFPLVAVFLAAASAAPVAGTDAEGRRWIGRHDAAGAALIYGTPDSDDVVLGFACEAAGRRLTATFPHEPLGARDGVTIGVELLSEGGTLALQALGHRLALDDAFLLQADVPDAAALGRVLGRGETLSVLVQDGIEELPLAGAAAAARPLLEACR